MTQNKQGFTLIELVVVMAIIAVLAALMVAAITGARTQSVNTQRMGQAKTIETALETYASKNSNLYPTSADIVALMTALVADKDLTVATAGVTTANFTYLSGNAGANYGLAACANNNTAAPTITLPSTAGGCTGSSVIYSTFR